MYRKIKDSLKENLKKALIHLNRRLRNALLCLPLLTQESVSQTPNYT